MKHAISAGHELTLQVAKDILLEGGNAFDAVTAAYLTMFITEPAMASAGGNGFALVKAINDDPLYFDFFCQTPKQKNLENPHFYPIQVNFGTDIEEFHVGLASTAVPGTIAGILEIHQRYGRIPFRELIQPASKLASEGIEINRFQAYEIELLAPIFGAEESGRAIFFENGARKKEGDIIKMPQMAGFLDYIADEGSRGFYEGEIARIIVKDHKENGGVLRMEDFTSYRVNISKPFRIPFRDYQLFLPNAPNKGGAALAGFLGYCEQGGLDMASAIKATQELLTDQKAVSDQMDKWYPGHNYINGNYQENSKGTSHINILDKWGNAISLTTSIGEGSGYFIPGTDMQLNNMLGELYLLKDGAHSWIPDQRLGSMMTPVLMLNQNGAPNFLAGSGGASRIPYAIGQVILHHFTNGSDLFNAIENPRYHFQNKQYQIEFGAKIYKSLNNNQIWDRKSLYFGGVHAISNSNGKLAAHGDSRRFGVAEVFT